MANFSDRVLAPLALITGGLVGADMLSRLKADMIGQRVFQAMFGSQGERIFVDEVPSYNETIFPLIEFYWNNESVQSQDTFLTGTIKGRIILPSKLESKSDINIQRGIAAAFARFIGSAKCNVIPNVAGLIEFGVNIEFRYDRLFLMQGLTAPAIDFTIPFKFDLHWLAQTHPEVDLSDDLDAALVGWVESYSIKVLDDNQDVIIPEGVLYVTGQTNP